MKRTALKMLVIVGLNLICLGWSPSVSTAYNPLDQTCTSGGANSSVCQQAENQGKNNPLVGANGVITKGIKLVGIVVGIVSVIMIVIGGFSLVASSGNPEKTATAKKRIIYALVGLVIAALAWLIVSFVTNQIL